jgi:hypothetical protein
MNFASVPEPDFAPNRRYIFDISELVRAAHGASTFVPLILMTWLAQSNG